MLSAPQRCNAQRSDAQRTFFTTLSISLFYSVIAVMPFPVFQHRRRNFLHRTHRPSAFASIFPFATMVYCTKQQELCQESQRSDVATGNARWPTQTQTQTQRCSALRFHVVTGKISNTRKNVQRFPLTTKSLCTSGATNAEQMWSH